MKQALSLHIGLNRVDPAHYGGWDGQLSACEFDAKDMRSIAVAQGFTPQLLLTRDATSSAVIDAIRGAGARLKRGDVFLLTYSGHGGQVPDTNRDEEGDRQDETWVLYDRELIDDELAALYARFAAGVRIMVLSDSCHSGTVTRAMPAFLRANPGADLNVRYRLLPPDVALKTYRNHRALYDGLQRRAGAAERARLRATVLLISGCQDNQLSLDGQRNGLFTEKLRKVWNGGRFTGNYRQFRDKIASLMPASQTPNYYVTGSSNPAFLAQKPFTV